MPLTGIAMIIIAVAICVLVLTLVPTLLTIKRSAASLGELTDMVKGELRPTLKELTSVLTELKTVGGGVAEHTDDVRRFMSALGETGGNLHTINRAVGVVSNVVNTSSALTTGAKVAGKYLLEQYLKKKEVVIMSDHCEVSAGTVLVSFVAGAAIGAAFALLYAPKSGREMRDDILDLTEDAVDKIKEYAKEAQDKIKTAVEDSKEAFTEKKSVLASALEAGREAMQRERASVK